MHLRAPKLLEDIRNAADFVKTATEGVALHQFTQNRMLRQAVERNFEIIGEAMRRLEKVDPDTAARMRPSPVARALPSRCFWPATLKRQTPARWT